MAHGKRLAGDDGGTEAGTPCETDGPRRDVKWLRLLVLHRRATRRRGLRI